MTDYKTWSEVPDTLATATTLRRQGLKPAKGQRPVGRMTGGYGPYSLYLIADAVPVRKPSAAQLAALEKAREFKGTFICVWCGERHDLTDSTKGGRCYDCNIKYEEQEMAAYLSASAADASTWARTMLAEGALILDTETTGLDYDAEIVQIAIIDTSGAVLLDSLVLPTQFPATYNEAARIHGISREMLADAPTMIELWPRVLSILAGATNLVIYNRDFDLRMLSQSVPRNEWSAPLIATHCAMLHYAEFAGQWSKYYGSFRWQPLVGGDHTALGDCRATLSLLQRMAAVTHD